jgi:hypothetical protein
VHNGLRVPTDDATPPIRSEPVEHALSNLLRHLILISQSKPAEAPVPRPLLVDRRQLILEALRHNLEELLCVLVLARVEERVGAFLGLGGEDLDDVDGPDGLVGGVGCVEFYADT